MTSVGMASIMNIKRSPRASMIPVRLFLTEFLRSQYVLVS